MNEEKKEAYITECERLGVKHGYEEELVERTEENKPQATLIDMETADQYLEWLKTIQ